MPSKSTSGLKEIAEATNLSIATVSRVLSYKGEVSQETRDRVFEVAREMRYRPNLLVRGIQTGKTRTMGVVVPPYDSFWTAVLYGVQGEFAKANHMYLNTWCPHVPDEEYSGQLLQQLHGLIDRRVDGIILWAHLAPLYSEHVEELNARNLPVVTIDHQLPFADSIESNEKQLTALAAEHLLGLGHRFVAHVGWRSSYNWAQSRRRHFEEAIASHCDAYCVTKVAETNEDVPRLVKQLLRSDPRPTAVFACSDHVARMIYDSVAEMGLRIPEDLSVVGTADLAFSAWMNPPLTTISQDGLEVGRQAARLLLMRSQGKFEGEPPQRVLVEGKLVERQSTCPPGRNNH